MYVRHLIVFVCYSVVTLWYFPCAYSDGIFVFEILSFEG
jgi:hypothetical protein